MTRPLAEPFRNYHTSHESATNPRNLGFPVGGAAEEARLRGCCTAFAQAETSRRIRNHPPNLGPFACEGAVSEADWGSGFAVK